MDGRNGKSRLLALVALNFPIDTVLSAPRRLQKHRQDKRDEDHEENGRQQDRHSQSRAATCMSAFTAKPPGMRETGGSALASRTIVGAVEPDCGRRSALRPPKTGQKRGTTRCERAIITPARHRTLILVKVPCSIVLNVERNRACGTKNNKQATLYGAAVPVPTRRGQEATGGRLRFPKAGSQAWRHRAPKRGVKRRASFRQT